MCSLASGPKHSTGRSLATDSGVSIPISRTSSRDPPTSTTSVSPSTDRTTTPSPADCAEGTEAPSAHESGTQHSSTMSHPKQKRVRTGAAAGGQGGSPRGGSAGGYDVPETPQGDAAASTQE